MPCIRAPGTGGPTSETSFSNWAGDVQVSPTAIYEPSSIDELVAIVKAAEQQNVSVHAVGSGWSFNDNFSTSGFLIRTDALNRILSNTMGAVTAQNPVDPSANDPVFLALTGKSKHRNLVHVEAGIKVHDLHDTLEDMSLVNGVKQADGFALTTLGGSGGQSLAGAISTSTHGGDVRMPPLPDMVQAVHLVAPGGVEYFIQRRGTDAIVDTHLLAQTMPCVAGRIISNNDILNAVLVSMGRMGVIYSMVVEVVNQFVLEEVRFKSDWATVSSSVVLGASGDPGTISDLWLNNRFLQIVLLPYGSSGNHDCYVSIRNIPPAGTPLKPDPNKNDPFSLACRLQPLEKSAVVLGIIAAAAGAAVLANGIAAAADAAAARGLMDSDCRRGGNSGSGDS